MELIKLAGSGLILASSVWAGLHAALGLRRTHEQLQDLTGALEAAAGEIAWCSMPFLPLCQRAGEGRCAAVQSFFQHLAEEAARPDYAPRGSARRACAAAGLRLPESALLCLQRLFDSFGRHDRETQLRQLELTLGELKSLSRELSVQLESRCRTYQMLGLTAGASVLVLVL